MRNYLSVIYLTLLLYCCTLLDLSLCDDVAVNTPHVINGKLQILQADSFTENQHRKFFLLHTLEGEVYHLNFNESLADKIADLNSDVHFEFTGLKLHSGNVDDFVPPSPPNAPTIWGSNHHHFHVHDFYQLFNFPHLEATKEIFDPQESVSLRRMVVLLLNFKDAKIDCSTTDIEARLWQNTFSVKSAYERNSYGTIEFYGDLEYDNQWDIYGPFDIDYSLSTCVPDDWATQGEYLATQSGVDLSRYQHRIYVLPSKSSSPCHWEGLGWIGCGLFCRAWINTCDRMEVFVHELGHNVGFTHAASDLNEMGNVITYGDPTAFMGNGWFTSTQELCFNAPHRTLGGWVPQEKIAQISSDEGIFTLSPLNTFPENTENFQVLEYQNPDNGVTYYFSYITLNSQYSQQCLVHYLSNTSAPSCFVKSLNNSDYFVDKNQRFSVTQLSMSEQEMSLWVVVGCKEKETIILGNNGTVLSAKSGERMNVSVTISNKDSPLCTPVTYKLTPNLPSGWEYELDSELLLAPGQTCTVDMWVTPKDSNGIHPISLSIDGVSADGSDTSSIHSTTFYSIITIDECSPQAFQMLFQDSNPYFTSESSTLSFTVINTDQEVCGDSTVEFSAKFPEGWKYSFASNSLSIGPGESTSNSITFSPPSGNFSSIQVEIQLEDTDTPKHSTSISTQINHESGCNQEPKLVLGTSVLSLNTRETVSTFLEISSTNGLHCSPMQYTLSTLDVEISIVPSFLTVFPSSSQSSIIIYTAPMMLESRNKTVMVTVQGGGNTWEYELEIAVEAVPCIPKAPTFYWACPDRLDNTTAIGVRCFYYIANNDNWPCPSTTWKLSFDTSIPATVNYVRPMALPVFPGNSSSWVPVDFEFKESDLPLTMSQISVTCNMTDITSDSQVANLHFAWFQHPMDLGACVKSPPIVSFPQTDFEMFAGDTIYMTYSIQNPYNEYCDWVSTYDGSVDSYAYLVTVNQMPMNLSGLFSPGSFNMKPGESRDGAQIILTHHIYDNSLPTNQTYFFTLDFYDPQNKTSLRSHVNITINVLSECYKRTPFVSIIDSLESIPVGQQRYMNFTVNVTNQDFPGCSATTFNLAAAVPRPGPGWSMSLSTNNLNLEPNTTGQFSVALTTRENLPPGNYSLNVFVSETGIINHNGNNRTSVEVMCPNPRPVTKITAKAIVPFFSFGLQEGPVYLSWDGCMTPLWCCCPCTYRIERNGEYIGTSPYRNFTDSSNLHAGVQYVYNITTIDRNGVASASSTCGTTIEFVIKALSVRDLLIFMSIAISILLFIGLALYLVLMFFKRKQDRKRGIYTPYCPGFVTHFCGGFLNKFRKPKNTNKPLLELDHIINEEEQGFLDEDKTEKRPSLLKFMGNDD